MTKWEEYDYWTRKDMTKDPYLIDRYKVVEYRDLNTIARELRDILLQVEMGHPEAASSRVERLSKRVEDIMRAPDIRKVEE